MFQKPATTIEEQIKQLRERGLIIDPQDNASHYLSHISYYRLAGYWWPMQEDKCNHHFKPNSRFADVIALYNFDRELRLILFDLIEKIEISLRTKLIYHLSHEFDPWWFQNTTIFQNVRELTKTLATIDEEIERCKDIFVKEHLKKHKDDGRFPPAWKTLELTSFGSLSITVLIMAGFGIKIFPAGQNFYQNLQIIGLPMYQQKKNSNCFTFICVA